MLFVVDVPNVTPNFDFPGAQLLQSVASWAMGGGVVLLVIAVIFGAVMLAFGHFSNNPTAKTRGIWVVFIAIAAAAIIYGGSALINFGSGMQVL